MFGKSWTRPIACAALSAALLLTACSPAPHAVSRMLASAPVTEEEDPSLARELEASLLETADRDEQLYAPAVTENGVLLNLSQAIRPAAVRSLAIPSTFRITRPFPKVTTTYDKYFITGTSDPDQPVYFGSTEIERLGEKGVFGVLVPLSMGTNTFTFRQGEASETVTVVRRGWSDPAKTPISEIRQSSAVPARMSGVKVGDALSVGCIAPSGATVTASYDGKAVTLKQSNAEIKSGLPAAFTGKITVEPGDYDPDITQKGGKVAYTMTYGGATKKTTSDGVVYVAGENSRIMVEITQYLGFIYPKTSDPSTFKELVKAGARDYIAAQNNEYFELASGGYIKKEQVKILTGRMGVHNKLSGAGFQRGARSETITFHGTRAPVYDAWIADDVFYLRLYNTSGTPSANVADSRLVSSCKAVEKDGRVTYQFPLKGLVWGYDVSFKDGDTTLLLKYKPSSLQGMTVLLDPGHGGADPGALGLAGSTGPTEAQINLANALAVKEELEARGATVRMTRKDDSYVDLNTRLEWIEYVGADVFLSLHHNSLAESTDANKVSGMEIYYHTSHSKKLAENMMNGLSTRLNRNNRFVRQDYYRVTISPYAPALLVELGYLCNPVEYEKSCSSSEMQKVAEAIADGIERTL